MGQSYCRTCCADKHIEIPNIIDSRNGEDEPRQSYAKSVKHYIDIHPKVKQVYLQNRDYHIQDRKGTKLSLHYLFQFAAYYQGEWKNGLPHGYGRIIYDDGSLYEGCFKQGTAECRNGLYIKEDGSYYKGQIYMNKAHGKGAFISDKICYDGQWLEDYPNGFGRQIYSNNSYYEGQLKMGKKHGKGEYHWSTYEFYEGEFKDDKLEGLGKHVTKQFEYEGQFKDGYKNGKGRMKNLMKQWQYNGQFQQNKFNGKGTYKWADGTKFEGIFVNNKKVEGRLTLANGEIIDDFNQQ